MTDPVLLFIVLLFPGGGVFLASWAVAMVRYRKNREVKPGGALFPSFRRVVFGRRSMMLLIVGSYTCGLFLGSFLLANTTTCTEAEFGF